VVLFNRGEAVQKLAVTWAELGLPAGPRAVRDIWAKNIHGEDVGVFATGYSAMVQPHHVVMVKVTAPAGGRV
jgi:hypothetical protein